jgi:hypothetical protein
MTPPDGSEHKDAVWEPSALVWLVTLGTLEVLVLYILFAVETPLSPIVYDLISRPVWLVSLVTMLALLLGFLMACAYQLVVKIQKSRARKHDA